MSTIEFSIPYHYRNERGISYVFVTVNMEEVDSELFSSDDPSMSEEDCSALAEDLDENPEGYFDSGVVENVYNDEFSGSGRIDEFRELLKSGEVRLVY